MASAIEQLASSISFKTFRKAEDLHRRLFFTLLALVVYRLGTYIPIPGINPDVIREFTTQNAGGILGILDMFSGGAISRMTIFSLNIMPYISASIIVQLLTSVSPYLEALKKEGETGKRKLNQYTRYGTVFLAAVQGYGVAIGLGKITGLSGSAVLDPGIIFNLTTMITLVGGTLFVMWLGEQITSRGIGNGISLIIYSGIVDNLPQAAIKTITMGVTGALSTLLITLIGIMVVGVIAYIVFMEKAQRRILIQYPKRQTAPNMPATSQSSHLPLKLNSAGVPNNSTRIHSKSHHDGHGHGNPKEDAIKAWMDAMSQHPDIMETYGMFSSELLQSMLGIDVIAEEGLDKAHTSMEDRKLKESVKNLSTVNNVLKKKNFKKLDAVARAVIVAGRIGRPMKLVERQSSNVSKYGSDDDKIGKIADLRSYEESDAASYVTDNTGEHFVQSAYSQGDILDLKAPNARLIRSLRR